jgi:glycosyltransferase involved in cell wall biosynthesis
MRICLINEYFYPDDTGGTGTVLSHLVRQLKNTHPELVVDVITTRSLYRGEKTFLPLTETWEGVNISRIGVPRPRTAKMTTRLVAGFVFSSAALLKLMKRRRYDLVLVTTAPPTLPLAVQWLRLLRTPYVYVIYDLFPDVPVALKTLREGSRIARLCRSRQKKWLRNARSVVVLGRCMRDYLAGQYELSAEKISVIPIWSDQNITPLSKQTSFRATHNLTGQVVLYAGNFGQCQDFDNLLTTAKYLRDADPGVTLVFVGDGPKKEYLANRIAKDGLSNVRLLPFVARAEFPDLLASADISLVTLEPGADGLGVPSKFYNILASGRPTVAVVGAHSEVARVLEEAHCGRRVEQGEPEQLAQTLLELLADSQVLERMGQNARTVFEEKYTLPHVAEKFYKLFQATAHESQQVRVGSEIQSAQTVAK